ncbi:MAG: Rad52/Rad22 family DNA repair protein [Paenisporosarcina sp.]|nr:Rad52/Rad22 family DNA repair protein [Paenisporosarcina sp.]
MTNTNCTVGNSKELLEKLSAPFHPSEIEWRVQSATERNGAYSLLVVPYLDSRAIMNRLDQVCGGLWKDDFESIHIKNVEAFRCRLSLKIGDEWVTRTDAAEASDIESVKGGHSNALKRAAAKWGIGRYLYDLPKFWVEVKQRGEHNVFGNFKVKGNQTKIQGYFDSPTLPQSALPKDYQPKKQQSNQQTTQRQPNQSQQTQSSQPVKPSQQAPVTQQQGQQPSTQQVEDRHAQAVSLVTGLLQGLNVPLQFVPRLLEQASGATVPYEQASQEDLGKLYHVLLPVHTYVKACEQYNLPIDKLFYFAQITLCQPIEKISQLFFLMTKEMCESTLELIKDEIANTPQTA